MGLLVSLHKTRFENNSFHRCAYCQCHCLNELMQWLILIMIIHIINCVNNNLSELFCLCNQWTGDIQTS